MKHRLVNQLRAENKRLRVKMKTMVEKRPNNCPMCSGISDETIEQFKEKMMSKCR